MKNLISTGIFLLLFLLISLAQNSFALYPGDTVAHVLKKERIPFYGIHIGLNNAYFNQGDKLYKGIQHSYQSFTGGGFIRFKNFQYELNFIQQGARNPEERNENGDKRTFKTTYLQVPITYMIGKGVFSLHLGGYASLLLKAKNYDLYTEGRNFSWGVRDKWKWYQQGDLGTRVAAVFNIAKNSALVGFSYNQGLVNVRNKLFDDPKMNHNLNVSFSGNFYVFF